MTRLRRRFLALIPVLLVAAALPAAARAQGPPPGTLLPELPLPDPGEESARNYLGLSGASGFTAAAIPAEVLLIEVFSMYCPHCQREAPMVNEVFARIEADPRLRGRVKMIGIGAGNTAFEVDYFRKTYSVRFPLFPDPDFKLHKRLGEVRTPYFIGVKLTSPQGPLVYCSRAGGAANAAELMKLLLAGSSLEPKEAP